MLNDWAESPGEAAVEPAQVAATAAAHDHSRPVNTAFDDHRDQGSPPPRGSVDRPVGPSSRAIRPRGIHAISETDIRYRFG